MAAGFQRIGHGGASALAPGNTLASFEAALAVGVDVIEFDVRARGDRLVLAHTLLHGRRGGCLELRTALEHLRSPRFAGVTFGVDLKHVGCEAAVIDALRTAGLLDRALFCSQVAPVLDRVRQLEPRAHTAISVAGHVARASHRWGDWRRRVLAGLAARRWDGLMAQHRLIDAALVAEVCERQAWLYGWTVNDRARIAALRALGVHGVATADPRLFLARAG